MRKMMLNVPASQPPTNITESKPVNHSEDCDIAAGQSCIITDGSVGGYITNDTSRSLSRDSSFSSYSTTSTTGSSGCEFADSPLRKIVGRSSSRQYDRSNIDSQEDRPCSRVLNSRRKLIEFSRESGAPFCNESSPNFIKKVSQDVNGLSRQSPASERSISENDVLGKSLLSTPAGLIISTPPATSLNSSTTSEKRRSKSESYDEKSAPPTFPNTAEDSKTARRKKKKERSKRRETTAFDWCLDETAMKRVLVLLEGNKAKAAPKRDENMDERLQHVSKERDSALRERDTALRERDEVSLDRDRMKCERDALQLERDNLLLQQEELKKELANRSSVIEHLKEHLGRAYIPVKEDTSLKFRPTANTKPTSQSNSLGVPSASKTRPRSKSEVRTPEFFVPDQIFQRSSAYTCL